MSTWDDYIVSGSISKTVEDVAWTANFEVDHRWDIYAFTNKYSILRDDHNGTSRRIFFGFMTGADHIHQIAAHRMHIPMVDHGWYLSRQTVQPDVVTNHLDSDPATIIEELLGGANSGNISGIGEYTLRTNPDWSSIQKTFQWTTKTSKWQAIQEMCAYTGYVFHVLWSAEGDSSLYAKAYFVKDTEIDSGYMDLPAAVTITSPDDTLIDINYIFDRSEVYNEVNCKGYNKDTPEYFIYITQSAEVAAGEECPVTYYYQDLSGILDTMTKTGVKSQALFDDLYTSPKIYVVRFKRRYDLQLYQKINFSGYTGIITDDMRITGITYNFGLLDTTVEIQCSPISSLIVSNHEQVTRSLDTNVITEEQRVASGQVRRIVPVASLATITDVSGNLVEVNMDADTNKTIWVTML